MFSRIGRWRLYVSKQLDQLGGGANSCCILGVTIPAGSVSQFVPFPATCLQPDGNYFVTGSFVGGQINGVVFAFPAKAAIGFQVAFNGALAGDVRMDFKVEHC